MLTCGSNLFAEIGISIQAVFLHTPIFPSSLEMQIEQEENNFLLIEYDKI